LVTPANFAIYPIKEHCALNSPGDRVIVNLMEALIPLAAIASIIFNIDVANGLSPQHPSHRQGRWGTSDIMAFPA